MKDVQATEEAFRIKIEHPTLQNMKFPYFSLFLGHLFLPGSEIGSSGTKSMRIHDPHHCIQPYKCKMYGTRTTGTTQFSGNFGSATHLLKDR
jgi:hypothetical protein